MAAAVVQTSVVPSRTAGATSLGATLSSAVTAGNALFVMVWGFGNDSGFPGIWPTLSCSDTQGNSYSEDRPDSPAGSRGYALFRALSVAAGSTTVTVSATSQAALSVVVLEVSGLTASPYDTGIESYNMGTSASPGSFTTSQANEILLSVVSSGSSSNPSTVTAPSGWTLAASETNGASYGAGGAAYQVVSSVQTSYAPSWAVTNGSWATAVRAYKAATVTPYDPSVFPGTQYDLPVRRKTPVVAY